MTSKVATPQATKRRKMGYDVDFLDDSGVPMDGVELDSSSPPTATSAAATSMGSSSQFRQHSSAALLSNSNCVSNSNTASEITISNHSHNIASTTNSDSSQTAITSTPDQLQQQSQLPQHPHIPDPEHRRQKADDTVVSMANNEAMTKDDPSSVLSRSDIVLSKQGNSSGPVYNLPQSENCTMTNDASLAHDKGQRSSTNNLGSNNHITNGSGSNCQKSIIRSFGDLFDDDDLD